MRIFLLGYMGSGKTTLGAALAQDLGWQFQDLDQVLEANLGMSVGTFIDTHGELKFRKAEHEALMQWLENAQEEVVLALGGGTPVFYDHMEAINAKGTSVFLDVSVGELARRLEGVTNRPLINSNEDIVEFVAKHMFERRPYYSQAHLRVQGNAIDVEMLKAALGL